MYIRIRIITHQNIVKGDARGGERFDESVEAIFQSLVVASHQLHYYVGMSKEILVLKFSMALKRETSPLNTTNVVALKQNKHPQKRQ